MCGLIHSSPIQPARFVSAKPALKKSALKSFKFKTLWFLLCPPNKSVRHFVFANNYRWLRQKHPTTSKDVSARLVAGNTIN